MTSRLGRLNDRGQGARSTLSTWPAIARLTSWCLKVDEGALYRGVTRARCTVRGWQARIGSLRQTLTLNRQTPLRRLSPPGSMAGAGSFRKGAGG